MTPFAFVLIACTIISTSFISGLFGMAGGMILVGVLLAYFDVAFVDRAIRIREEETALLDHFSTLAEARYSQGVGLQQAVVKLQAEITRVRSEIDNLKRQRVDAEAALNALLDRPPSTPLPPIDLRRPALPPRPRGKRPCPRRAEKPAGSARDRARAASARSAAARADPPA